MTPLPVKPLAELHDIVIAETERPDAIETVPIDIVYEPEIEPALLVTAPDAVTVDPNSDSEPFAVNDQLLLFVYEPDRFNVVPPSTNAPEPVKPALGLHDIVNVLIVMPVATVKLFIAIVNEPETVPDVLRIDPVAATVAPKIDVDPLALNVQVDVFV
jgi:hypothetical protein